MAAVAVYLLMAIGRVHQLFPVLDPLHPALLAGLAAIVLYLADGGEGRRVAWTWTAPARFLLSLLAWMVLSVPGALVQGTSLELVVDNFLKTVFMFFVIAGAVRGFHDVERLAFAYLTAVSIYAVVVVSRFDLGAGDAWRLGDLYYYDANDFATLAVTAMPIGLYGVIAARQLLGRLLSMCALGVLALTFVWTGSRGGFIALVAACVYVVLRYRAVPIVWRATATALVALVLVVSASDQYWRQIGTIMSDADYNRTDETGRLQIWSRGIDYTLKYPVLGLGPDNFPAAEGMLSPLADRQQLGVGLKWSAAHNSFIQVGAELGVPGLAFFLGLLITTFATLRRAGNVAPQLAQALTASLIAFVVGAFFLSLAYHEMLYTLVALSVGLYKVTGWTQEGALAA